jgi:protein SCO1/2
MTPPRPSHRLRLLPLLALVAVFAIAVAIGYAELKPERTLPVLEPSDFVPAVVDAAQRHVTRHRILPFTLINQLGDTVTLADVSGQILVTDFFFTRCPTICPVMTSQLKRVQDAFRSESDVRILSHSVTPAADSVPVLAAYAQRYGADPERWWFLTGDKAHIYALSRKSYFSCLEEGDGGDQDFVHTENVVLVDRAGRLRGVYDGTSEDEVNQLIADMEWLLESGE